MAITDYPIFARMLNQIRIRQTIPKLCDILPTLFYARLSDDLPQDESGNTGALN